MTKRTGLEERLEARPEDMPAMSETLYATGALLIALERRLPGITAEARDIVASEAVEDKVVSIRGPRMSAEARKARRGALAWLTAASIVAPAIARKPTRKRA